MQCMWMNEKFYGEMIEKFYEFINYGNANACDPNGHDDIINVKQ